MKKRTNVVNKAKNIYLDPRSRFFKRRFRSLTASGYELGKKTKNSVTLTLKDA